MKQAGDLNALGQLRRALQGLRHREEGLCDRALFMLESDGRVATWNARAERMLGYSRDEMVGRPVTALLCRGPGPDDDLQLEAAGEQDHWVRRADGSRFLGRFAAHPLRGPDAQAGRCAVELRDVTEAPPA